MDGTVEEDELYRMFKDSQLYPAKAGKEASGKVKVPSPGRKLFTANLCEPPIPLQQAAQMKHSEWKVKWHLPNWRAYYYEYVVPLAKLSRLLRQTTTTRATDKHAVELYDQYMRGSRLVFGVDFMLYKTIYHRGYHVLTQPEGKVALARPGFSSSAAGDRSSKPVVKSSTLVVDTCSCEQRVEAAQTTPRPGCSRARSRIQREP